MLAAMERTTPRWVRWWFRGAAVFGVVALLPGYVVTPAPAAALTHYGFTGTALAFQIVFWIIAGDPVRYRALMLAGVAEKLGFVLPAALLAARGAIPALVLAPAAVDFLLGVGFLVAWRVTPARQP
jgi:hypothetical protein